ncbi:MAG: hypothetical protein LBI80_05360, partial [Endomicrobium sp.]|nr:hypothetical protein [Endomicrobium sp.]
ISCGCGAVINITVGSSADSVERVDVGCGTDEVVEPVVSHTQPVVVTPVVRHTPPPAIVVDPVVESAPRRDTTNSPSHRERPKPKRR